MMSLERKVDNNKLERWTFGINANQLVELVLEGKKTATTYLYEDDEKYKENFFENKHQIETFEKVNLITPENIHLNSFMYEPILDISEHQLKKLYFDLKNLNC